MRVVHVWLRESPTATAHLHTRFPGVLDLSRVSECGRIRSERAYVTDLAIARCGTCASRETRLAREQVAA